MRVCMYGIWGCRDIEELFMNLHSMWRMLEYMNVYREGSVEDQL